MANDRASQEHDDTIFRAVGIGVSNLKRSTDFYTRICGMKHVQTIELDTMIQEVLAYPTENFARGSRLLMMHWTDGSARNYKDLPVKIVLQVADAASVIDAMRREGVVIVADANKMPSGNTVAFANDPDGYLVELLQPA